MRKFVLSAASVLTLLALPAVAQDKKEEKTEKPVTNRDPNAVDVVATPANDLNIRKKDIPDVLRVAEERPYNLRGLDTCRQLGAAIGQLNTVLGDDVDVPAADGKRTSAGRVAQSVVGSFIPFRGIIREISGANAQDRAMQSAIISGVARRSFLKGIGQGKGCRYPARSATLDVYNYRMAAINKGEEPWTPSADDAEPQAQRQADRPVASMPEPRARRVETSSVRYVSKPVVQRPY